MLLPLIVTLEGREGCRFPLLPHWDPLLTFEAYLYSTFHNNRRGVGGRRGVQGLLTVLVVLMEVLVVLMEAFLVVVVACHYHHHENHHQDHHNHHQDHQGGGGGYFSVL